MAERQPDAQGLYGLATGVVDVQTPEDLVEHGIRVSDEAISATWGQEGVESYQNALTEKAANAVRKHVETQPYMGD